MNDRYQTETRARWGDTDAYRAYAEKTKEYTPEKWDAAQNAMDDVFARFAASLARGEGADSETTQSLVRALQDCITVHYYPCTKEILEGLGQMYNTDERFQTNIDAHGEGTAAYVFAAISVFCRA